MNANAFAAHPLSAFATIMPNNARLNRLSPTANWRLIKKTARYRREDRKTRSVSFCRCLIFFFGKKSCFACCSFKECVETGRLDEILKRDCMFKPPDANQTCDSQIIWPGTAIVPVT